MTVTRLPELTPGQCWQQAHAETRALPSWERGARCLTRYMELLAVHGHPPYRPDTRRPTIRTTSPPAFARKAMGWTRFRRG